MTRQWTPTGARFLALTLYFQQVADRRRQRLHMAGAQSLGARSAARYPDKNYIITGGINHMEHNKKINRSGAVSLPAALRREYGIEAGEKVNINVNGEGVIEIKRIEGACVFCHSDQGLKKHEGRYICQQCLDVIRGL